MKLKLLIRGLSICLLLSTLPPSFANAYSVELPSSDPHVIKPMLTYIAKASCNLTIDSGTAYVESSAIAYSNVSKVKISASLQQYNRGYWFTLKTFNVTDSSDLVSLSETHTVSKGYKYRVSTTVTAYCGSSSETVSVKSGEVTY